MFQVQPLALVATMDKSKGVGTELAKLIPRWAYQNGCKCKKKAAEYDSAGVAWCEQNIDQIVQHLTDQSEHLIPVFRVVPASGRQAIAKRIVQKAIKNAKIDQTCQGIRALYRNAPGE